MSDRPPKPPLSEAEKDDVLREIVPILHDLRVALANYNLQSHEIGRLGGIAANHEERIKTVEAQIIAGVHVVPEDSEIPVTVEEPRLGHLSPPPDPPRPPMSTHESINVLVAETTKQTTVLTKTAETNQQVIEANRMANARYVGAAIGAAALIISQNCSSPLHLFQHPPAAPSVPAQAAPPPPAPR